MADEDETEPDPPRVEENSDAVMTGPTDGSAEAGPPGSALMAPPQLTRDSACVDAYGARTLYGLFNIRTIQTIYDRPIYYFSSLSDACIRPEGEGVTGT